MWLRSVIFIGSVMCAQGDLRATSCSVPPPCGRVHEGSILFVGTVLDAGVPDGPGENATRAVRFQLDEIFIGVPAKTKEVVVETAGSWLIRGHSYLIDAARGKDNRYYPVMCGGSAEVGKGYIDDVLDFLKQRAQGKTKTSFTVSVIDNHKPVPGVEVAVSGPEGALKGLTGPDGLARFDDIKPAKYRVAVAKAHYHVDKSGPVEEEVSVVVGSCAGSWVAVESEASVSGFVRDAKGAPVASLELELITVPENPADRISLNKPFFTTKTGGGGEFRFEAVSPGHYLLGSNVIDLSTSPVPPTFYPGRPERNGAVPIDVEVGSEVAGLAFVLPDFGSLRDIQVCVVDESGNPVPGAGVGTPFGKSGAGQARLGEKLITDNSGCVKARGYTRVAYPIRASFLPPGTDWRQSRNSESIMIPPGEDPVVRVLTLGKPLFAPKPK